MGNKPLEVAPELWPILSMRYGLHPRDARLPPEQGGLTFAELDAYIKDLDTTHTLGAVIVYFKQAES